MTKTEYEKKVKEKLYELRGTPKEDIDREIEKEKEWFFSYYPDVDLAVANFVMWV